MNAPNGQATKQRELTSTRCNQAQPELKFSESQLCALTADELSVVGGGGPPGITDHVDP